MIVSNQLDLMILKLCSKFNDSVILNWLEMGKTSHCQNGMETHSFTSCSAYAGTKLITTAEQPPPFPHHGQTMPAIDSAALRTFSPLLVLAQPVYRCLTSSHLSASEPRLQLFSLSMEWVAIKNLLSAPSTLRANADCWQQSRDSDTTRTIFHAMTCCTLPRVSTLLKSAMGN